MANLGGVDYGEKQECRVCQYDRFIVERGQGTVNDKPVSVLTIRCSRCGTPLDQLEVDWSNSVKQEDKVNIHDGIVREPAEIPA
ncbi:MAG: hypothetical protein PHU23_01095 [Dehalococcoidales bacterium]|nr:hypothetical protein [Dehalococcoidales bacterium]